MNLNGIELECSTIGDLVELRAANGDKPLVWVADEMVTYAEAHRRSNQIANELMARGVRKGDVVASLMYNHPDAVCIWFACAKIGAIWAPTNISLVNDDLAYALNDSRAKTVIVAEELLPTYLRIRDSLVEKRREFLWGDAGVAGEHGLEPFEDLLRGDDVRPSVFVASTDPMSIVYTGGSTGMPKGVLVPHLYYFAAALRYQAAAQATAADTHFAIGQLFHGGGQQLGLFGPMYCNMTTALARWFSASRYWDRVREHGATVIDPIGPIISAIMATPERPDDRNHNVRIGVGVATGQIRRALPGRFRAAFQRDSAGGVRAD